MNIRDFKPVETSFALQELKALDKANWHVSQLHPKAQSAGFVDGLNKNPDDPFYGYDYYRSLNGEKGCKVNWYAVEEFDDQSESVDDIGFGPFYDIANTDLEMFFWE